MMIAISVLEDPHSMNLPVIERIYPKASELSEILNYNPCPECAEVFHNTPNLEMHLAKCHGRETSRISTPHNVIKQYYCPEPSCKYSGGMIKEFGTKFFKQHKYLKQHYIKVHMEKKFVCEQCGKGFATIQLRKRHLEECGLKFVCSCGAKYNTIAALLTHASRKRHTFIKSWTPIRNRKVDKNDNVGQPKQSPIFPKPKLLDTMVANTAVALSELSCAKGVDIAVQTEPTSGQRRRRNKSDTSRQTQTGEKRTRISSETQTIGEYCHKGKKNLNRRRKKSMETQTKVFEHTVVGEENQYVEIDRDFALPQLWFNSSTQTSLPTLSGPLFEEEPNRPGDDQTDLFSDINTDSTDQFLSAYLPKDVYLNEAKSCSTETQTEFSFESLFENYTDSLTNIETQTSHELWDQYNNICTQTCDDIFLVSSDIETQTEAQTSRF